MSEELDLLVVGAGPAGIATAVEARRAGIARVVLLEKGPTHSYSIEKLYTPGKRVDKAYLGQHAECEGSVCIVDGTRETALETLETFVAQYRLDIRNGTEVEAIRTLADGSFEVRDKEGHLYHSRTVVIAIGVYGRPNKPSYPIPTSLKGHVWFDLSQDLPAGSALIIGGGNTALEYAEYLYAGRAVTLAYRGAEFTRANEINRSILARLEAEGRLAVWREADVEALRDAGGDPRVAAVFKDGREARFDHVLYAIGGATPEGFLKSAGVELEGRAPKVDAAYQTSVPGLYLAGDLVAGGKGTLVKAFNTGNTVVWEGLCNGQLECRIPERP
jgi:thioredoxin reductase (NADPH)